MSDLVVVVPTRGRPHNAARLARAIDASECAHVVFVVDADDPTLDAYSDAVDPETILVFPGGRPGIVDPLNWAASQLVDAWDYISFAGDDHLPRTPGWDVTVIETLKQLGTGICYGDDLLMGERIPTAVFMTSDIPRTLGYMVPPALVHLFADNVWLEWGKGLDRIKYLPDVVIEHIHFLNGKAEIDETYERCNDPNAVADRLNFSLYQNSGLVEDLDKLRPLLQP